MNRRTRFAAGLLTSLALTLSLSQSVWASTCAPDMQMHASAGATSDETPPGQHCGHEGRPEGPDQRWGQGGLANGGEDAPHCPFNSPAAAQSCAGVASLPAYASIFAAFSPERVVSRSATDVGQDLLLQRKLFRPPRA